MEFRRVTECFGMFPNAKVINFSNEQFLYKKNLRFTEQNIFKRFFNSKKEAEDTYGILR